MDTEKIILLFILALVVIGLFGARGLTGREIWYDQDGGGLVPYRGGYQQTSGDCEWPVPYVPDYPPFYPRPSAPPSCNVVMCAHANSFCLDTNGDGCYDSCAVHF